MNQNLRDDDDFNFNLHVPTLNFDGVNLCNEETLNCLFYKNEEYDKYKDSYTKNIFWYCFGKNDEKILCKIINFPETVCISLDDYSYEQEIPNGDIKQAIYHKRERVYWNQFMAEELYSSICYKCRSIKEKKGMEINPVGMKYRHLKDFYFFTKYQNKHVMFIDFNNEEEKRNFQNNLRYPIFVRSLNRYCKYEFEEQKITTQMRLVTVRKFRYNKWFECKGHFVPMGSKFKHSNENVMEYYINYKTIKVLDDNLTSSWFVNPKLVGADIETYGHRGVGIFTSAAEYEDVIFTISLTYRIMGKPETEKKYCLLFGDCYDVEGIEVFRYNSEADLLVAFCNLIVYLDPDIVLTYNGNNFDWPYIIDRLSINGIISTEIPEMGRLVGMKSKVYTKTWKSSGAGLNIITYPLMSGRLVKDLLPLIKRGDTKLIKYSLDYVAKEYLGYGKIDISIEELFRAYKVYHSNPCKENLEGMELMTNVVKYCDKDAWLCIELYEKRMIWYHCLALAGSGNLPIDEIINSGEQRRTYSNLYYECYHNGFLLSRSRRMDYYCSGGFVGTPIRDPIIAKEEDLKLIMMKPPDDASPELLEKIKKLKEKIEFLMTIDFASLYPSIMQAYNLCYTTYVPVQDRDTIPKEICNVIKPIQEEPVEHFSISRRNDIGEKIKLRERMYEKRIQFLKSQKGTSDITEEMVNEAAQYVTENVEITEEELNYFNRVYTGAEIVTDIDTQKIDEYIVQDPLIIGKDVKKIKRKYEFWFVKTEIFEGFLKKLERNFVADRKTVKNSIKGLEELKKKLDKKLKLLKSEDIHEFIKEREKYELMIENIKLEMLKFIEEEKMLTTDQKDEIREKLDKVKKDIDKLKNQLNSLLSELEDLEILQTTYGVTEEREKKIQEILKKISEVITEIIVKDRTQNAIKIIANSCYGFTGVMDGMLCGLFISICVTFIGRTEIQRTNSMLEYEYKDRGIRIIYNDTDSSMFSFHLLGNELPEDFYHIVAKFLKGKFKEPLELEIENMALMLPMQPKMYFKKLLNIFNKDIKSEGVFKLDKKGNYEIIKKGVMSARRGNTKFQKNMFDKLAFELFNCRNVCEAYVFLRNSCCDLLREKYSAKELSKVVEIGTDYAGDYYLKIFFDNMVAQGKAIETGKRFEIVIIKTQAELEGKKDEKVGMKCYPLEEFEKTSWLLIDYEYYITHGLETQYDDLFDLGYSKIAKDDYFKDVGYTPKFSNCHFVHFSTPIKMVGAILKDLYKPNNYEFGNYLWNRFGETSYDQNVPRHFWIANVLYYELNNIIEYICREARLTIDKDVDEHLHNMFH